MSRDASLDFHFVRPMTLHEILEAFEVTGARPAGRDGRVAYQVDYDWTDAPLDQLETVLSHLVARSEAGDAVGIEVGWPDAVGGNVLFGDRRVVTFILPAD